MSPKVEPQLRDAVVVDGIKYRIRSFETGGHTSWRRWAYLREHFTPHRRTIVVADELVWDDVAGVWRVPA